MNGRPWNQNEDAVLRRMWSEGRSSPEIGTALKRPPSGVRRRAGVLGLNRRDDQEREHLAQRGRLKHHIRPLYTSTVSDRIANIRDHFASLSHQLREWGRETDKLAKDMGVTLAVALFLVVVSAPAPAADLWHIWPAGTASHRKDLAGTRQPAGVLLYDFHAERVDGKRSYLIRAKDIETAKAAVKTQEGGIEFTRQPFRRPPAWWIPNFYVDPACQHLRGIMYEERHC